MVSSPIVIAYGGTLSAHKQLSQKKISLFLKKIKHLFWTYNNDIIDQTTRSAWSLIHAINYLNSKELITSKNIHVHLWGNIDKEYNRILQEHNISEYFTIEGFKSKKETQSILKRADILFLPLESSRNNQKPLFIPGKLFEYLYMEKPILLLADKESECATIGLKSGLGLLCEPRDWKALSDMLLTLINKDLQGIDMVPDNEYIDTFSFKEKTKELSAIFDKLSHNNVS